MGRAMEVEGGEEMDGEGGTTMGFLYDLMVWIADEWPEVEFWADMGVPRPDSSLEHSSEDEVDGDERFEDHAGSGVYNDSEERYDNEVAETGPFRIVVIHSQSCYSSRGDKFTPSGLMIRGFEEDAIELLGSREG